jgi:hypothetical protein
VGLARGARVDEREAVSSAVVEELERVGIDDAEGIGPLEMVIDSDHLEADAVIAHAGPAGAAEEIEPAEGVALVPKRHTAAARRRRSSSTGRPYHRIAKMATQGGKDKWSRFSFIARAPGKTRFPRGPEASSPHHRHELVPLRLAVGAPDGERAEQGDRATATRAAPLLLLSPFVGRDLLRGRRSGVALPRKRHQLVAS